MNFRLATFLDAELIFNWRNDSLSRTMSHQTELIEWETHQAWLQKTIENPNGLLFIAFDEKKELGTIRVDIQEQHKELLSWMINPTFRGMGIGNQMLAAFLTFRPNNYYAQVKITNIPSQKMCLKNGFIIERQEGQTIYFYYQIA